jgi:hypothetical protein
MPQGRHCKEIMAVPFRMRILLETYTMTVEPRGGLGWGGREAPAASVSPG